MPKLPGEQDLGGLPTPAVVGVDTSALQRGAADIAQGGERLGAGVTQLGQSVGDVAVDKIRFDYAKAHADFLSRSIDIDAQSKTDTNYAADASGKTLPQRYTDSLTDAQQQSAQLIDPGPMRDRFITETKPIIARGEVEATARARGLQNNANIAYVGQQGDNLINKAISAPDDATRTALIDSHNQLVDGLAASGAVTPVQALGMKQAWAKQYATADLMHRADTDPQGVIDELQAAPGSGADITNRIIGAEGSAKNAASSATGVGQFTDATWLDVLKRNRPDLAQGRSDTDLLALRADKGLARDMTDAYRQENAAYLTRQGVDATPGAQYLAHFLGPGGAAAVLKADPNQPVADVLGKAVGKDKAAQMIAANPTILNGQLAGSVKQWADSKMGGQVPGGGSIYDVLTPDVRETLLAHAQSALEKQQVQGRADFQMRVANATSEALNTGDVSKPLTPADFIGEYGAANGPAEFAKYDTAVQLGRTVSGMATMTPAQRTATVNSLQPQPGDPNYALKEKAYDVAQRASNSIDQNIKSDPAAFAVGKLTASKDAYAAFSAALSGSDETRAAAAQNYATTVTLDQQRVGVPATAQKIVPQAYAYQLTASLQKAAANDNPQARVALIGQVQREASMWGQYWPAVMRQLAPATQPVVRAIAAGADPVAMTRVLSLDPKASSPEKILAGVPSSTTTPAKLSDAVAGAMAPFKGTMVGAQYTRDYVPYQNLATQLASLYVAQDNLDPATAATKAFNDVVGRQYDFRDSYRIPKSAGVNADQVQAGALAARSIISGNRSAGGSEGLGLSPAEVFARNAPFVKPGASSFVTALPAADESKFQTWVKSNNVAFDPAEKTPDYDMRGFWKALQAGDPRAKSAINPNDGKLHFPDYWKTPYDVTFSNESQWANAGAPAWNDRDQLVSPAGRVVYDDRAPKTPFGIMPPANKMPGATGVGDLADVARDGKWVTAPDNGGLMLANGDDFVRTGDGKPLTLSWDQLSKLGASPRPMLPNPGNGSRREFLARHGVEGAPAVTVPPPTAAGA